MTVAELKKIEPLADFCEIKAGVRYLVHIRKKPGINRDNIATIADGLRESGLECVVVLGDMEFYELPDQPKDSDRDLD